MLKANRTREGAKLDADHFYDPHAAHLLGELIEARIAKDGAD